MRRFLAVARPATGLRAPVAVRLMDDAAIRRLNCQFRFHNHATDVLSFPSSTSGHAGDIAISVETAARQARACGHDLDTELRILLLHALLHLAGMDHESDHGEMRARERLLRRRFGLPTGLLERTQRAQHKGSHG
ncbi:MAG: rRNA maturation RNase YbeY [Terriglobales bacterium]